MRNKNPTNKTINGNTIKKSTTYTKIRKALNNLSLSSI